MQYLMYNWIHYLYVSLLIFATVLALLSVLFAARMRETPGRFTLILLMSGVAVWCFGCVIELQQITEIGKLLACKIQYLGIATVPVTWFLFVITYVRRDGWLTGTRRALLWIIPTVTLLLMWTNEAHHLMYQATSLDLGGYPPYWRITYGAWFWIHVSYNWGLVAIALCLAFFSLRDLAPFYRRQVLVLLGIAFFPLVANIVYVLRLTPLPYFDLTPVVFAVSGVGLLVALRFFYLVDLSPIARNAVFESMIDGVVVLDTRGRIMDSNPAMRALLGKRQQELYGIDAADIFAGWLPAEALRQGGEVYTVQITGQDGTSRWFDLRVTALRIGKHASQGWLLVLRDITDRHGLQERLNTLAFYDHLTGLPNRLLAHDRLMTELARARRLQTRVALLYLDADGFKWVNDTHGHSAGDHLLQLIAARLTASMRETDTIARVGGDEFVIVVSDLANPEFAIRTADRILAAFTQPFMLGGEAVTITMSIGIAVTPDDGMEIDALFRHADDAMYHAKLNGKNAFVLYANLGRPADDIAISQA
ncbi:MAG: Cyclic di-GMP phosphodiesterase Gmr [bacterium ADurb.Bin429]|nr:MAG: Cyclic di-GMP phosphodiesterase Gmr [bacterium ADurb.Bin429]